MKRSTAYMTLFGVISSFFFISCSKNDQTFTVEEQLTTEAGNSSNASNSRFIKDAYIVILKSEVSDVERKPTKSLKVLAQNRNSSTSTPSRVLPLIFQPQRLKA
jgi:hypothetical protein